MSAVPSRRWHRHSLPGLVSLRQRAQIGSFLLIMLLAGAIGTFWSMRTAARIREQAGTALLATARDMADRLSQEMAARARDVALLAEIDMFRDAADPAAMRSSLERLRSTLPAYAWIGMTDPQGQVIAGTDGVLVGKSIAARPVFSHGREGLWTGDVHDAVMLAGLAPHRPGESVKFVDVAAPVRAADGSFRGVLALHMSWQWAAELRDAVLKPRGAGKTLQLLVLGPDGNVLLAPSPAGGSVAVATTPARASPALLSRTVLQRLDEQWSEEQWSDGLQALTAVAESRGSGAFKGFGWRVLVRDDSPPGDAAVGGEVHEAWVLSLGAGATLALLAWCLIGWSMAPMDRLAQLLRGAAGGQDALLNGRGRRHTARRNDVHQIAARLSQLQEALRQQHLAMRDLERLALRDELTGLFNRTYLTQLTAKLEDESSAMKMEMCVLCLDLDHFKPINDEFGHAAGDEVLRQVAARLRRAAREEDIVLRLGGDEFLLLLPCPVGEGAVIAQSIATRILTGLQRPMSYRTTARLSVGASVGAAIWRQGGTPLPATIAQADEALFAAKRAGRGRFRQYSARLVDSHAAAVRPDASTSPSNPA